MPRGSNLPPTPAPSTDITGKENGFFSPSDPIFSLPPSAIASRRGSSSDVVMDMADAARIPLSPTSPRQGEPKKKTNTVVASVTHADITLPPPPTRSRKIIQMKPGAQHAKKPESMSETPISSNDKGKVGAAAGTKRKQGATTSAGRKIARKTAHSIIERRRRSKMNEEFGVLKDMVPACSGQEMHKLAILQASIEYLRYLEQCVSDLKAGRAHQPASSASPMTSNDNTSTAATPAGVTQSEDDSDEEMENDDGMSVTNSPIYHHHSAPASIYATITASPAFSATSQHSNFRFSNIELPPSGCDSMNSRPVTSHSNGSCQASYSTTPLPISTHTSPIILAESSTDSDHEASAALLLLNATDRRMAMLPPISKIVATEQDPRRPKSSSGARGMSVQDLLRT